MLFRSFVKSHEVAIKALAGEVTKLDQKMDALQASEDEALKALTKLNDIDAKIDAQKLELDEIKALLSAPPKKSHKH